MFEDPFIPVSTLRASDDPTAGCPAGLLRLINAGHWEDGGSGPGFNRRYEFAEDCVNHRKAGISYLISRYER